MRKALQTLPCVESSSIKVDVPSKEARFTVKEDAEVDVEAVKKAVQDVGFTVSAVKAPEGTPSKTDTKPSDSKPSAPAKS